MKNLLIPISQIIIIETFRQSAGQQGRDYFTLKVCFIFFVTTEGFDTRSLMWNYELSEGKEN